MVLEARSLEIKVSAGLGPCESVRESWVNASLLASGGWLAFWACLSLEAREGDGTPFQYSCLANPMDGGAWWAAVHGVAKSWTRLNDFTFTFHFHAVEKEMATHSSVLAWRIPGTGEPGGLLFMGSHRVGHDRRDLQLRSITRVSAFLFARCSPCVSLSLLKFSLFLRTPVILS